MKFIYWLLHFKKDGKVEFTPGCIENIIKTKDGVWYCNKCGRRVAYYIEKEKYFTLFVEKSFRKYIQHGHKLWKIVHIED
jgi:ribosomal protein L37AE/L43A